MSPYRCAPAPRPVLVLAVHGTRDPRGTDTARALAAAVAAATGVRVELGFADVVAPDVGAVAASVEGPVVVVPAFLASGYHVRTDIPEQLAAAGRSDAAVAAALDGAPAVLRAAARRLAEAGRPRGGPVVLAAAGSSDPAAQAEAASAAAAMSAVLRVPVEAAFIATCTPTVPDTVARMRARHGRRVSIASWLLAPGLFHSRLSSAGADTVAAPLCGPGRPDPAIAAALAARYRAAAARLPGPPPRTSAPIRRTAPARGR